MYECIEISGAKNAALPVLFSTLLVQNTIELHNIPLIEDVKVTVRLLEKLGKYIVIKDNLVTVFHLFTPDNWKVFECAELISQIRYSILLMGLGLAIGKKITMRLPGGCTFSERPIDIHIECFKKLGAIINVNENYVDGSINKIEAQSVRLRVPSVTATENVILLLAAGCEEEVKIYNAAKEPEIIELCCCINKYEICRITGQGTEVISISPFNRNARQINKFNISFCIGPDRIEMLTYIALAIAIKKKVEIKNINYLEAQRYKKFFEQINCHLEIEKNSIIVNEFVCGGGTKKRVNVLADFYPCFPTDGLPILAGLFCGCNVEAYFEDKVFSNRFSIVEELHDLDFNICIDGDGKYTIQCHGNEPQNMKKDYIYISNCRDIRCGMGIIIAALASGKKVILEDINQVKRGYDKLEEKMYLLGVDFFIKGNTGYINLGKRR